VAVETTQPAIQWGLAGYDSTQSSAPINEG